MALNLGLSSGQQFALVLLRTLIGWHFLYEGYFKLIRPAWTRSGEPLAAWSAAGYLKSASGPLAGVFHALGDVSWIGALDIAIAIGILLIGLSLILGLFTRVGCIAALIMLTLFYLSGIPLSGQPEPRAEGVYLLVNKNLIEAAAVIVLLLFPTGLIAGIDRWLQSSRVPEFQGSKVPGFQSSRIEPRNL